MIALAALALELTSVKLLMGLSRSIVLSMLVILKAILSRILFVVIGHTRQVEHVRVAQHKRLVKRVYIDHAHSGGAHTGKDKRRDEQVHGVHHTHAAESHG